MTAVNLPRQTQKNEMGETTFADGEAADKSRNTSTIAEFSQS